MWVLLRVYGGRGGVGNESLNRFTTQTLGSHAFDSKSVVRALHSGGGATAGTSRSLPPGGALESGGLVSFGVRAAELEERGDGRMGETFWFPR